MIDLLIAGGWVMPLIVGCSVIALSISIERYIAIDREKVGNRRDIPVAIVADNETRHAMVVMSMDTVSQLGFKRLSISAQRPSAGE